MANPNSPDAVMVSTALACLEKLKTDQYIIAFGPNSRQFFATPNGYAAVQLPMAVLSHISREPVRSITWASYGSQPDSWFFAFEMADGTTAFQVGADIPPALQQFIDRITPVNELCSALRVQLGKGNSFVAWAKTCWACHGVPVAVQAELCQLSGAHMRSTSVTRGSLRSTLSQIAWHDDGSYFIKGKEGHLWHFESSVTSRAWATMLSGKTEVLEELVLVALDPHAPVGETFAFIKKQHDAQEAPFFLHFLGDTTHATETPEVAATVQDTRLKHLERQSEKPEFFRWAISKRSGRPHAHDAWELELEKGQKVKVWKDLGRDWHIVEGRRGIRGWVHGTWLTFCGNKVHEDARSTYQQFQKDMRKMLVPGQLRAFPPLRDYTSECANAACQSPRDSTQLGICAHDLQTLLEGSGQYSYQWLKEERNVWHPDKFARYCDAEHKEHLKVSAQEVFVLYGVLMDCCLQHREV